MKIGAGVDLQIAHEFNSGLIAVAGAAIGKVYVKMADAVEAWAKALSDRPISYSA